MRTRPKIRFIELSIALVLAGFCGASCLMLYELRQDTWNQAITSETNLLNVLSQDIARNVEIYDLSLRGVAEGVLEPELASVDPKLQDQILYDRAASARDMGAILVLDRQGKVVRGSTDGSIGADLSDREYFTAQKDHPDRGLFISAPFANGPNGLDKVIALSRSIRSADGAFAGVVVGTMRLHYFLSLFSRSDIGSRGSINLFRTDGICLMRVPYDAGLIGRAFGDGANFRNFLNARTGSFSGKATLDGVQRIYSFAHVADYPLVLDVALAEEDVFAVWRTKSMTIGFALAALCATALGLGRSLRRQLDRTARAEKLLSRSEAQYRLLANHSQDVIARLDRSSCRTYVSPAVTAVLGYQPEELVGHRTRELVHPDDWPTVARLIGAAQKNQTNAEVTYRILHKDGHYVWMEGRYSIVAEDGGFIAVLRDITNARRPSRPWKA